MNTFSKIVPYVSNLVCLFSPLKDTIMFAPIENVTFSNKMFILLVYVVFLVQVNFFY